MTILQMSLTGGIFIAMVLLLRLGLQNYVTRRVFPALWLVANALLLIPIRISSPTSVYNLPPHQAAAELTQPLTQVTQKAQLPVAQATGWTAERIFTLVWLCGAALVMGLVLANHIRARRRYRFSLPFENPPDYVPKRVRVRILDGLASPLTYGILRPVILLPVERPDERQLEHMLRHELCHIRHMDVLRKLLMLLACALHWFNPMVWLMLYVAGQDMEMRCDALVIRRLGRENRSAYARTLVHYEIRQMQNILDTGFSYSSIDSRLQAILKAKRIPVFSTALAVALLFGTVTVFATGATTKEPEGNRAHIEQIVPPTTESTQPNAAAEDTGIPITLDLPVETQLETSPATEALAETESQEEQTETQEDNQTTPVHDNPGTTPAPSSTVVQTPPETEPPAIVETQPAEETTPETISADTASSEVRYLPTKIDIPFPGNYTIKSGETWEYSFATPVPIEVKTEPYNMGTRIEENYQNGTASVSLSFNTPGIYEIQIRCIIDHDENDYGFYSYGWTHWLTVTVTE